MEQYSTGKEGCQMKVQKSLQGCILPPAKRLDQPILSTQQKAGISYIITKTLAKTSYSMFSGGKSQRISAI
jgi:hypothetical protein